MLSDVFRFIRNPGLVMISGAFFDESGSHNSSLRLSVAGYIFEEHQLPYFEQEWSELLVEYELKQFHMADCAHGVQEFSNLTPKQRDDAARRAIGIVCRRASFGIAVSVGLLDFKRAQQDLLAQGISNSGTPYRLAIIWSMLAASQWALRQQGGRRIAYVFETGHEHERKTNAALAELRKDPSFVEIFSYHSHSFIGKADGLELQAADILAWEWNRDFINSVGALRRPRRSSLNRLVDVPTVKSHFDERSIKAAMLIHRGSPNWATCRRTGTVTGLWPLPCRHGPLSAGGIQLEWGAVLVEFCPDGDVGISACGKKGEFSLLSALAVLTGVGSVE